MFSRSRRLHQVTTILSLSLILIASLSLSLITACTRVSQETARNELAVVTPSEQESSTTSQPNIQCTATTKKVDVLFVIDNSPSMESERDMLAAEFPTLLDGLRSDRYDQQLPDLHIGVISPDLGAGPYTGIATCEKLGGDDARLQHQAASEICPLPLNNFLTSEESDLNQKFACIAKQTKMNCGFEQPLEAARRAVDPRLNLNPGFLREDALLVVVILTDEDDCSAQDTSLFDPQADEKLGSIQDRCARFSMKCDEEMTAAGEHHNCVPSSAYLFNVQSYVDFFKRLKPGQFIFGVVGGPSSPINLASTEYRGIELMPSCFTQKGNAAPSLRLQAAVDSIGDSAIFSSICEGNLKNTMQQLNQKILTKLCL